MAVKAVRTMTVAGEICHSPAISWSSDNRLALSIDDGIHILEPILNGTDPTPFTCTRTFIPASPSPICFNVGCNREEMVKNLDRDIMTKLMLDPTLCPDTPIAAKNKGFRAGIWSPPCLTTNHRCILASLSLGHQLMLHQEVDGRWEVIEDLSSKFYRIAHLNKFLALDSDQVDLSRLDSPDQDYHVFKSRMYFLAALEIVWTQCFTNDGQDFAFLISAMKSGHLVFWKVNLPCSTNEAVVIETVQDSSVGLISCLTWHPTSKSSGLLVIGSHSGLVQILPISIFEHSLTIGSAVMLWEDDDFMTVRCISVNRQQPANCVIVCGKIHYIVSSLVTSRGELIRQAVSEGIHSLPLTNICSLVNGWFLACSLDSNIYKFQVDCVDEDITLSEEMVEFDIQTSKMLPYGIIQSPNAVFCCLVQRMACMFDHLAYREPIRINFFINQEEDAIWSNLLTCEKRFSDCKDIQEFIRVRLNFENALPKVMNDILESDVSLLRKQTMFVLKLVRFILNKQISPSCSSNELAKKKAKLKIVSNVIQQRHFFNVLAIVYSNDKCFEYSPKKLLSLISITTYLYLLNDGAETSLSDEEKILIETVASKAKFELPFAEQEEKCSICQEVVPFIETDRGGCCNDHFFGRCSNTVLLCDNFDYKRCPGCHALMLTEERWSENPICVFCDEVVS